MSQPPTIEKLIEDDETVLARRESVRKSNALWTYGFAIIFLISTVLWLTLLLNPAAPVGNVTLGMFLFGLLCSITLFISAERNIRGNRYYITDRRVLRERDFVTTDTNSVKYEDIGDLEVSQGLIDRFFGTGTVEVRPLIDSGTKAFTLKWIEDVDEVETLISDWFNPAPESEKLETGI